MSPAGTRKSPQDRPARVVLENVKKTSTDA
jgi:hypothetical protein